MPVQGPIPDAKLAARALSVLRRGTTGEGNTNFTSFLTLFRNLFVNVQFSSTETMYT